MTSPDTIPANRLVKKSDIPSSSSLQNDAPPSRHILCEEEYVGTLSAIISRDYYPSIRSLQRDLGILECRAVGDRAGAVAIRRKARQLEESEEAMRSDDPSFSRETVDGFHGRVTSEDNEEFEIVQRKEIQDRKEWFERVFERKMPVCREDVGTPLLASDQFNDPMLQLTNRAAGDKEIPKNCLFFTPRRESLENRSEAVTDRLLMPPPSSFRNNNSHENTELKRIVPTQTRFPHQSESRLPSLSSQLIQPAILSLISSYGSPFDTECTTDLDRSPLPLSEERTKREDMLARERETFVNMTPVIVPGKDPIDGSSSPIMTWGDVASTPMVIHARSSQESSFYVNDEHPREKIARDAEAKLAGKKRPPPRQTPSASKRKRPDSSLIHRVASLTPAARSLLSRTSSGTPILVRNNSTKVNARSKGAFGSALRKCYTPTPPRRHSSLKRAGLTVATPKLSSFCEKEVAGNGGGDCGGNITDGLLQV